MTRWDTCDMQVYLGKDRTQVTADMTATHPIVKRLTRLIEGYGHEVYMDSFFPLLTYSTIWLNGKSVAVEQYDVREKERHMTWNHQTTEMWRCSFRNEMTWQQCSGKINVTYMYCQIGTVHHQWKVAFVTYMEKPLSSKLYRTVTKIWDSQIKVTEWWTVSQSSGRHESGQNFFSTF
jgi:hypothetical protein